MKKKVLILILLLAPLSTGGYWFITRRSHRLVLPIPAALEAKLMQDDALLACNNMRTSYIKNPWGDLGISTSLATISRSHIVRASSVHIKHTQGAIQADEMLIDIKAQKLSFKGNVKSEIGLSPAHKRQR